MRLFYDKIRGQNNRAKSNQLEEYMIGTRKVYWHEIKDKIKNANFEFYTLVDRLNPGVDFPLYILNFPYGELIGDEHSQFLPLENGTLFRLNDPRLPNELNLHLGYGKSSSPLGMIIDKQFEWYVDLPQKKLTLPVRIQSPGEFFSYTRIVDVQSKFNYSPMGVLSAISGGRSIFMLPSIGCQSRITKLCRDLKIKTKPPGSLYEHFNLFKTILNCPEIDKSWYSSLIYFSENWIHHIKNDPDWFDVRRYFYTIFAKAAMYLRHIPHYQTAYSLLLETTNQKPNPYLFDSFKHLIDIMTGETPGFSPQMNHDLLPLEILQDVFLNSYGLKHQLPTIMGPSYFKINSDKPLPVYYSLQYPTTRSFSPNSRKSSIMEAMREFKDICVDMLSELIKDNHFCSNTIIQHIAQNIEISFFHNSNDIDGLISNVGELLKADQRFYPSLTNGEALLPAEDSKFFRGCIRIAHK